LDDVNNISAVNSVTHVLGSKFKRPQTATIVRRERSASAWGAGAVLEKDNKLQKVLELRKRMADEKEAEIVRRAVERENRHDRTNAMKERRIRQKSMMVIVKVMYWTALFREK
jgi:hypothetical protein